MMKFPTCDTPACQTSAAISVNTQTYTVVLYDREVLLPDLVLLETVTSNL